VGNSDQCEAYCTKDDTRVGGPYRFGTRSGGQGARNDIINLRNAIREGKRGRELYDDPKTLVAAVKYSRGVTDMLTAYSPAVSREDIQVTFHYGPS